jgi:small-conductance mechanosensitive channel
MWRSAKLRAAIFGTLLAATAVVLWTTRNGPPALRRPASAARIDGRLLETAQQLAPLAEGRIEREAADQAVRLADHEVDLAYASALREAAAVKPAASGPIAATQKQIADAKSRIAADQARIAALPKDASVKIEVAKAQLALDQDELDDAQADLERQGGDPQAVLLRARQAHEAAQRAAVPPRPSPIGATGTLAEQIGAWRILGERQDQIVAARQQALTRYAMLAREHATLEAIDAKKPPELAQPDDQDADSGEDPEAMLARLRELSDRHKTLAELDRRMQDTRELAGVYQTWGAHVETRRAAVGRLLLHSLALVFGVLLLAVLAESAIYRIFRDHKDRRRRHQQRFLISLGARLLALGAILLIAFGTPSQTPTIIGLATAGLTVVLKDFVVAFIGWFILIGRNGVRAGDWVEINGVSGEVIEVGLFKTVLLEMGSWTSTGHPTGRRISFMNGYAIEGRWFNFSTAGQWLWDELQVSVPAGADPYAVAQRIREMVETETEESVQLAEQEWERITRQYGARTFSAKPAVDLRPGGGGLEVHVRYIVRAPQRYELKSKLFREVVELLAAEKRST